MSDSKWKWKTLDDDFDLSEELKYYNGQDPLWFSEAMRKIPSNEFIAIREDRRRQPIALATLRYRHTLSLLTKSGPGIAFGFADNKRFNAFASKKYGEIIAIEAHVVNTTMAIFDALMSNPRCLPIIGNPQLEDSDNGNIFLTNSFQYSEWRPKSLAPIDEHRRIFRNMLFVCAMEFIFLHEFYHLNLCHIELISTTKNIFTINESEPEAPDMVLTRQCFEYQADCDAVSATINRFIFDERFEEIDIDFSETPFEKLGKCASAILCVSTAIYILFRIMGKYALEIEMNNITINSHPPSRLRQIYCANILVATLKERGCNMDNGFEFFQKIFPDSIDSAISCITGTIIPEFWTKERYGEIMDYLDKLIVHNNIINNELRPLQAQRRRLYSKE